MGQRLRTFYDVLHLAKSSCPLGCLAAAFGRDREGTVAKKTTRKCEIFKASCLRTAPLKSHELDKRGVPGLLIQIDTDPPGIWGFSLGWEGGLWAVTRRTCLFTTHPVRRGSSFRAALQAQRSTCSCSRWRAGTRGTARERHRYQGMNLKMMVSWFLGM